MLEQSECKSVSEGWERGIGAGRRGQGITSVRALVLSARIVVVAVDRGIKASTMHSIAHEGEALISSGAINWRTGFHATRTSQNSHIGTSSSPS